MNGKDERAKILERIKKLMALADNRGATEAEAMAAALAAQKLIAEYDVEEWELHSKDAEPMVEKRSDKASRRWRWHLAAIIGPAFRCRHFQRGSWNIKAQKNGINKWASSDMKLMPVLLPSPSTCSTGSAIVSHVAIAKADEQVPITHTSLAM